MDIGWWVHNGRGVIILCEKDFNMDEAVFQKRFFFALSNFS
jgi:hypothetical protein